MFRIFNTVGMPQFVLSERFGCSKFSLVRLREAGRLRTQLAKERVLARRGWAGQKVGIFSSRPEFAQDTASQT
jgi:hypothetical protein